MDFLTLLWGFVTVVLVLALGAGGVIVSFWLRCDSLRDQKQILQQLLDSERAERVRLTASLLELQAALRAERFQGEHLRRQLERQRPAANAEC